MNRKLTSYYFKAQSGEGVEATMAGTDAVEITFDSAVLPFKQMGNDVARNNIRASNLPQKTLVIGSWGENPGDLIVELHGSGTVGTAPEYGEMIKSLFGEETVVASTSVTYSMPADNTGDDTFYTIHSFLGKSTGTGTKVSGVDARVRLWGIDVSVGEIITQRFNAKSLTATTSDANDPNTPSVDDLANPFVGDSLTFTSDGDVKCMKSVECTVERTTVINCANASGISQLPEDSFFTIEGSMVIDAEDDTEITRYFEGTLGDIVIAGTVSNGGVSETVTITLIDCQYGAIDGGDDDNSVEYTVPYTVTGGVTVAFT
jgi:hypothetical protein